MLPPLFQQVSGVLRRLARRPATMLCTVITLSLGIAAATAMLSLLDGTVIRPIRVGASERLVFIEWHAEAPLSPPILAAIQGYGNRSGGTSFSESMWRTLESGGSSVFEHVFAVAPMGFGQGRTVITRQGHDSELATVAMVSPKYFAALQLTDVVDFDQSKNLSAMAVISHGYARRSFQNGEASLGKTIFVGGVPHVVAGVTAPGFAGHEPGVPYDVWIPLREAPFLSVWGGPSTILSRPDVWSLMIGGRLRPDLSYEMAESQLTALFSRTLSEAAGHDSFPGAKGLSGNN